MVKGGGGVPYESEETCISVGNLYFPIQSPGQSSWLRKYSFTSMRGWHNIIVLQYSINNEVWFHVTVFGTERASGNRHVQLLMGTGFAPTGYVVAGSEEDGTWMLW